jgi:hypothetical protein
MSIEGSDEGEPMSLSDLLAPDDVFEVQDLEHDLEQALADEHYPRKKQGRFKVL